MAKQICESLKLRNNAKVNIELLIYRAWGTCGLIRGTNEHDHFVQVSKGYFWDKFDGTRNISTIEGNFYKTF